MASKKAEPAELDEVPIRMRTPEERQMRAAAVVEAELVGAKAYAEAALASVNRAEKQLRNLMREMTNA